MKFNFIFRNYILFLLVLFTFNTSNAQKPKQNNSLQRLPDVTEASQLLNNMKINQVTGIPVAVYRPEYLVKADTPEKMARQYLSDNNLLFQLSKNLSELRYITTTVTPGGYHVHFIQYIGDYPVLNSGINVTISRSNRVVFVMNGSKSSVRRKAGA